jgi:aldehyde dehydrogenase (NAD+)
LQPTEIVAARPPRVDPGRRRRDGRRAVAALTIAVAKFASPAAISVRTAAPQPQRARHLEHPLPNWYLSWIEEDSMTHALQFYIDGKWVDPVTPRTLEVLNPATEEPIGTISLGSAADVDRAVAAARAAFERYAQTTKAERIALLERIIGAYQERIGDLAETISQEMGAPAWLAKAAQAPAGLAHFAQTLQVLQRYEFDEQRGTTRIVREPVGVCGLITPWNWPVNQIACKVAPALAAGCTMVLKPSEIAPLSAVIVAEILDAAGVPAGVFNLVQGDGPTVGAAIAGHPGIDMVSFTGSTRAGVQVAKAAADTVKRVAQELGGKSANIVLEDADVARAVRAGVRACFTNSGQSCNAPTRLLVPRARQAEAVAAARAAAEEIVVGDPGAEGTTIGPVVSAAQFDKIQRLIQAGISEGAELVTGGPGRPPGLQRGYYVRPTVFANVRNDMTIAREEIFGPVLSILPYDNEEQAVAIANDTPYGLSGYVQSGDTAHALRVAARLRTGNVHVNGAGADFTAPFGGYKQSGNGREWGEFGFEEFLEVKAIMGAAA